MNRPSKNIDDLLIAAAIVLLPDTGCAGLSVRKLVEHAGVNLGMFHYHFKNKDNFIRVVLARLYEEMFSDLQLNAEADGDVIDKLRATVTVLGGFARERRAMLMMLLSEASKGEPLSLQFLRENMPRHIAVIMRLVMRGQAEGRIVDVPVQHLLPFMIAGIAGPSFAGAAIERQAALPPEFAALAHSALLSPQALAQRIELALRAIVVVPTKELP
ncbi:MAG: TetR/AcrR family transcriptional regulator [Pseudomonadota bacterium]